MTTTAVCPVLIGREPEMSSLALALASGGGLVLVAGEAGMGKTRLLHEFASVAGAQDHAVVWARPEAMTAAGPYSLVSDLIDAIAVAAPGGKDDVRSLADAIGDGGSEIPPRQVAARVRGLAEHLGRHPVLVLEDLHVSDELSHAVVAHLARSARDDGILLLATYRPEEAGEGAFTRLLDLLTRDRLSTQIDLAPLGPDDLAAMLEVMWGESPTAEDVEAITSRAEGIPFFVEELAAARGAAGAAIPPTIARAVTSRMQMLDDTSVAIMRVASLATGALDPVILATVSGIDELRVPRSLLAGVAAGLLADQDGRLVFRHSLVRDCIAESIVSFERSSLHRSIAAAIEHRYSNHLATYAPALARHFRDAGEPERAAAYGVMAGRRALEAGALDEARAAFAAARAEARERSTQMDAIVGAAEVAIRTRDFDEAAALFREAAGGYAKTARTEEAARALLRLAWLKQADSDRSALNVLDEARDLLSGHEDDPLYARVLVDKGYALARTFHELEPGESLLLEGAKLAGDLGDLELQAEATEGLAWVSEFRGDAAEAEERGGEASRLAMAAADDELIGKTHGEQALRLAMHGGLDEALRYLERAREHLVRGAGTLYVHTVDHLRAWLLWRKGFPAEADRAASRLEATRWARHYAGVVRVWAAAERGDDTAARAILSSWWEDLGGPLRRQRARVDLREVAEADGSAALALLAELVLVAHREGGVDSEALALAERYDEYTIDSPPDMRLLVTLLHARCRVSAGDLDGAAKLLGEATDVAGAGRYPLHESAVVEIQGLVDRGRGFPALDAFDHAAAILERCGNLSDRARCLRLAAGEDVTDRDAALARLRDARELASYAGALVELNKIEQAMRALGARPRAGRPKGSHRSERGLSPREEEVVALVAAGATNAEIAGRLFLSERTVQDHIANSQRRLGVTGRAGLAAWAAKQGLI